MRVRSAVIGTAMAAVLALTACAGGPGAGPNAGTVAGGGPAPAAAASSPLDFIAPTVNGSRLDAGDLAGKPVVLWFWAPWCTICRAEAPDVAEVAAELAGRVRVVGVAGRGPVDDMRRFVADTGTGELVHLVDADGSLWNRFGVIAQPAFVFVSSTGKTRLFAGSLDGKQLRDAVSKLE